MVTTVEPPSTPTPPTPGEFNYPLDLSGIESSNLVQGELHTVSEAHFKDYFFLVPEFAPFYVDNFTATISVNGVTRALVEDVDFSFALSYVTGTRTTGKQMYGGITLHNLELNGIITVGYQTVGGNQTTDKLAILTKLADMAYNPRTTTWDTVTNVPEALPPAPHYQDYDTFFGQNAVVEELQNIVAAIAANSSLTTDALSQFLSDVGLDNVLSYLRKSGDTMEGPLILSRSPEEPMEAVNRTYLELNYPSNLTLSEALSHLLRRDDLDAALDTKLSITGGTLTGPVELHAQPTTDMQPVNKKYLDDGIALVNSELNDVKGRLDSLEGDTITREEVERMIGELTLRIPSRKN